MNIDKRKKMLNRDIASKEWIGEVVESNDPLRMLRCRIRIFGLFDDISDELLPWAFPVSSTNFSSTSGGFGSFSVPKTGTLVKVRFNSGEIYAPEYFAIQNINETIKNEIREDYENAHVLCFDEDEDLRILYTQNQGLLLKLKDTLINVLNDNSIVITNPNGDIINLTNDGNLTIKTADNINIETNKDITLKCINATIDASEKINLGNTAIEALIQGTTFKTIFENHTHIGNLGAPTGTAIALGFTVPLSILSFTE